MSGVTRPSGPLPARIYWVRRAVVLGTAFVLVFALARLLGGGSDDTAQQGEQAKQAAGAPTSEPTSEVDSAPTDKQPTGKKGKQPAKVKETLPVTTGDCLPEEVRVSPEIRSEPAGGPRIRIPITLTTDREACTFVFSAESVVLKITSGNDNIWSSQQCPAVLRERTVVVRSMRPVRLMVVWDGKRSDEECSPTRTGWAFPGGYHAIAATLGGEPVDQYFELTKPESKVVTKVREPKRKAKAKAGAEAPANAD